MAGPYNPDDPLTQAIMTATGGQPFQASPVFAANQGIPTAPRPIRAPSTPAPHVSGGGSAPQSPLAGQSFNPALTSSGSPPSPWGGDYTLSSIINGTTPGDMYKKNLAAQQQQIAGEQDFRTRFADAYRNELVNSSAQTPGQKDEAFLRVMQDPQFVGHQFGSTMFPQLKAMRSAVEQEIAMAGQRQQQQFAAELHPGELKKQEAAIGNLQAEAGEHRAKAGEAGAHSELYREQAKTEAATRDTLMGGTGGEMQPGSPREAVAQARANYQLSPPTVGMGGIKTQAMKLAQLNDVLKLNPQYDENAYARYKKAEGDWFAGGVTSDAGVVASAQKLIQHIALAEMAQKALENPSDSTAINAIRNAWYKAFGSQLPTNVETIGPILATESAKYLSGAGGTLSEPEREKLNQNATRLNGSREQQQGGIDELKGLMIGQLEAQQSKYETAFQGHPLYQGKFNEKMHIMPEIQKLMTEGVNLPGGNVSATGINTQKPQAGTGKQFNYVMKGGKLVPE